jgi:methylenetetrahydrofolate reductase (NADPH)
MSSLLDHVIIEIVPLKSGPAALAALRPGSTVSVTCSPAKGIEASLELASQVVAAGHQVIPHLAARMVEGREHVARIAAWFKREGVRSAFVIGGDQESPSGPYRDGIEFLEAFLGADHGLTTVGFAAYPDGHALIDRRVLHDATHAKQGLVELAGLTPFVSTQMCFDPATIRTWLEAERAAGLRATVHLGIPGVVDRTKLLTMGARLGIGTSLRFLKKNRATVGRLLAPGGYDPSALVRPLEADAERLGIDSLHLFTFNEVEETERWREAALASR